MSIFVFSKINKLKILRIVVNFTLCTISTCCTSQPKGSLQKNLVFPFSERVCSIVNEFYSGFTFLNRNLRRILDSTAVGNHQLDISFLQKTNHSKYLRNVFLQWIKRYWWNTFLYLFSLILEYSPCFQLNCKLTPDLFSLQTFSP